MSWVEITQKNNFSLRIAGVDEVGRGAWAGPLVAAAVILPLDATLLPVRDSKKLTAAQREALFPDIIQSALSWSVVSVPVEVINQVGIQTANTFALSAALTHLHLEPNLALVDGFALQHYIPVQTLIHGDALSYNIAAASIVAKVVRDHILTAHDGIDDRYGFAQHKGYGTALHWQRLKQHGVTQWHRRTFAPIRRLVI